MRKRGQRDMLSLGVDAWLLGLDASAVIGLRMAKLATGDAAAAVEAQRMVTEKIGAAMELQMIALTGGLGTRPERAMARSIKHYGPKVRANRRRLAKR